MVPESTNLIKNSYSFDSTAYRIRAKMGDCLLAVGLVLLTFWCSTGLTQNARRVTVQSFRDRLLERQRLAAERLRALTAPPKVTRPPSPRRQLPPLRPAGRRPQNNGVCLENIQQLYKCL